jgi:acetyl esterase/lipase
MPPLDAQVRPFHYGPHPHQAGDLYRPHATRPPVVCLLHGGFWRMPHGRDQFDAVAADLVAHGYAVWNLGYRRLGEDGGGWPGTFADVAAGLDHLATLVDEGVDLDLERVVVVGHSAGGHLSLWSARGNAGAAKRVHVAAVVGLAPVADLVRAQQLALGDGAVDELLGGTPAQQPERYRTGSPFALLPLAVRQLVLHGTADAAVPIELSRAYAQRAAAAGDPIDFVELEGAGHMEFLDPRSGAHAVLVRWLDEVVPRAG